MLLCVLHLSAAPRAVAEAASTQHPRALPPNAHAFGRERQRTVGCLAQYVFHQPASSNPLTDPPGAGRTTGQSGLLVFLVGTSGSGTATRAEVQATSPGVSMHMHMGLAAAPAPGDVRTRTSRRLATQHTPKPRPERRGRFHRRSGCGTGSTSKRERHH